MCWIWSVFSNSPSFLLYQEPFRVILWKMFRPAKFPSWGRRGSEPRNEASGGGAEERERSEPPLKSRDSASFYQNRSGWTIGGLKQLPRRLLFKGCFAAFFFTSRPPLLREGGESVLADTLFFEKHTPYAAHPLRAKPRLHLSFSLNPNLDSAAAGEGVAQRLRS